MAVSARIPASRPNVPSAAVRTGHHWVVQILPAASAVSASPVVLCSHTTTMCHCLHSPSPAVLREVTALPAEPQSPACVAPPVEGQGGRNL